MPVFEDENELNSFIQDRIQGEFKKVMDGKGRPGQKFSDFLKEWWPDTDPRVGRHVDLILATKDHKVVGVEVKYRKNQKMPFSEGLDQALSYLLLGFHFVTLWHF